MKLRQIIVYYLLLISLVILIPAYSAEEEILPLLSENETQYWEVVAVTEFIGNEEKEGNPFGFGPFTYSNINGDYFTFTIGAFPNEIPVIGVITGNNEFTVSTPNGGRFSGTLTSDTYSYLDFYPVNTSHYYSFYLKKIDYQYSSNSEIVTSAAVEEDIFPDSMFMAGVSSGLSGTDKQQQNAENAWISGNNVFTEQSAISCDDDTCSCEGESCVCTGFACNGEGQYLQKTDIGYICSGYDCYLSCQKNSDCEIFTV